MCAGELPDTHFGEGDLRVPFCPTDYDTDFGYVYECWVLGPLGNIRWGATRWVSSHKASFGVPYLRSHSPA